MFVRRILLEDFRNHVRTEIQAGSGLHVLYGENGQGKTNMVEALFVCATGRSHRTIHDREMIRYGCDRYRISLEYTRKNDISGAEDPQQLTVEFGKERRKQVTVNEVPVRRLTELVGNFHAVMFSPEEMAIIREGPASRRRFIDIALCQASPSYLYHLQRYLRVVEQKNRCLKRLALPGGSRFNPSAREKPGKSTISANVNMNENATVSLKVLPQVSPKELSTLEERQGMEEIRVWNALMAETGAFLIDRRTKYTERLNEKAAEVVRLISGDREQVEIIYSPSLSTSLSISLSLSPSVKKERTGNNLEAVFEKHMKQEIQQASALYGPHRDDWVVRLNGRDLRIFGSQGQQRTAAIALKVAEALVMEEETGQRPVIIFDDILSELDAGRQKMLTSMMTQWQVFATCTEKQAFHQLPGMDTRYYHVSAGTVIETDR